MDQSTNERLFGKGILGEPLMGDIKSSLKQRFIMPPFSVWSQRDEVWQQRKQVWIALGIKSELGRDIQTYSTKAFDSERYGNKKIGETSIFDPVVCELCYSWFCPPKGRILDPFAGGSVRGIVASVLGYRYYGIDLSLKQVEANRKQICEQTTGTYDPIWVHGDSHKKVPEAPISDLILTCPPYGDLEKYSDDPYDISNMDYTNFLDAYRTIILFAAKRLRENRFAIFVVCNFRDKQRGLLRDFVGDTIRAFEDAGLSLYNEAVLISPCGTAPVRAARTFVNGRRKLVRLHQNILFFVKGNPPGDWQ